MCVCVFVSYIKDRFKDVCVCVWSSVCVSVCMCRVCPFVCGLQVSAGAHHSLLLTNSGDLLACGGNTWGQLGLGHTQDQHTPVRVPLPEGCQEAALRLRSRRLRVSQRTSCHHW